MADQQWWDVEIAFYVNKREIDPGTARTFTILRWMNCGDLRPLEASIVEGYEIDKAVLNLLADMISGDSSKSSESRPIIS